GGHSLGRVERRSGVGIKRAARLRRGGRPDAFLRGRWDSGNGTLTAAAAICRTRDRAQRCPSLVTFAGEAEGGRDGGGLASTGFTGSLGAGYAMWSHFDV